MNRIYCCPDSDVLKNKTGVRDSGRLSQLERRLTMLRLLELIDKGRELMRKQLRWLKCDDEVLQI